MSPFVVALMPAFGALFSAGLAIYCWRRPDTLSAREFALFGACIFVWTSFHTLEILSLGYGPRLAFAKLGYLGIAYAPVAWLAFALRYTQHDRWLRPPVLAALTLLPSATLLLALTEPAHGLLWREVALVLEPFPDLAIDHGVWFNRAHLPYSYGLYLLGAAFIAERLFVGSGAQRRQSAALLAALLLPFAANLLYTVSDVTLYGLDTTSSMFVLSALLVGTALFGGGLLRDAPLSYRTVFLHSSDGIILTDARDRVLDANPAALAGRDLREVRLRPLAEAFPPLHRALSRADASAHPVRYPSERVRGRVHEARDHALYTLGGRPVGRALLVRDVTHEQRTRETLVREAEIDPLTTLPNRRALQRHAETALASRTHRSDLALFYIDLDGFKQINDRHGHAAGDLVLREVAARLRGALRDGDLVARLGGDEFAVLVRCDTPATAQVLQKRLRGALERPIDLDGTPHTVRASIGISLTPEHGVTLDALLGHADGAMYRDKRERRGPEASPA